MNRGFLSEGSGRSRDSEDGGNKPLIGKWHERSWWRRFMGYSTEEERRDLMFRLLIGDCMRRREGVTVDYNLVDGYNGTHTEIWRVSVSLVPTTEAARAQGQG